MAFLWLFFSFLDTCWNIIKSDIISVLGFPQGGLVWEKSYCNFYTLIPEKYGTLDVMDFQSISLVGGVHKILVKIMANWLRLVVENILKMPMWRGS